MADILLRKLKSARASLTKTITRLYSASETDSVNLREITICRDTIKSQQERLDELTKEFDDIFADNLDELSKQLDKAEEYYSKTQESLSVANMLLVEQNHKQIEHHEAALKLPKISLPTFSGDILQWQEYFEAFNASVDNQNIPEIAKFQYLKASLSGEAASTLAGLPITSDNFRNAIELLKSRYGSTKRVIRAHVRSLLILKTPNMKSSTSLRAFVDSIHRHMRGLEALNVTSDHYEIFLCEILLSVVPNEIKHEWAKLADESMDLKGLLQIIENEAKHQEILGSTKTNESNFTKPNHSSSPIKGKFLNRSLVTIQTKCSLCNSQNHQNFNCPEFLRKEPKDRLVMIKQHKLCVNCLKGHNVSTCLSASRCKLCNRSHNTLLHIPQQQSTHNKETSINNHLSHTLGQKTVLPTLEAAVEGINGIVNVGILLDSGSDRSYISANIIDKIKHENLKSERLNINSFSGNNITEHCRLVRVHLKIDGEQDLPIDLLVCHSMNSIKNYPIQPFDTSKYQIIPKLCKQANDIDILVGSDNYYKIASGKIEHIDEQLKLIETCLGWTYHGVTSQSSMQEGNITTLFVSSTQIDDSLDIRLFWSNELAGILPKEEIADTETIIQKFEQNISFGNGRYSIRFPWLPYSKIVSDLKQIAFSRLAHTIKKLIKSDMIVEYNNIFKEYLSKGIIEETTNSENFKRFIPHHPVVRKDAATTKIRIVFDASARDKEEISLNDCLYEGPNLFPNQIGILYRFRLFEHAVIGDIEKAFLQISIKEEDRDFTSFLWYKDILDNKWPTGQLAHFRFCRVPFGLRSSPFILNKIIKHHLEKSFPLYPDTVEAIKNNLYVDDLVISHENKHTLGNIVVETKAIFESMSMKMHKFHSNANSLNLNTSQCKVLGLIWNIENDSLGIKFTQPNKITTKRQLASFVCGIYDPLGLFLPFTNNFKYLLQQTWLLNVTWDETLPEDIIQTTKSFLSEASKVTSFTIPRWFNYSSSATNVEFCAFSDASLNIYTACIYFVFVKLGVRHSYLMCSKSRVAPKNPNTTIPRLELLAALLSARLLSNIVSIVPKHINFTTQCFSDSLVALSWIKNESKIHPKFIQNRVKEIRALFPSKTWSHIASKSNPADLATRPTKVRTWLHNDLWWFGPSKTDIEQKLTLENSLSQYNIHDVNCQTTVTQDLLIDFERFSTLAKLIRTCELVIKFCRLKANPMQILIKLMQAECYSKEIHCLRIKQPVPKTSSIFQLDPFLDSEGVLRVTGRLQCSALSFNTRHPIILSNSHSLTKLIIRNQHICSIHAGPSVLCNILRSKYWIPKCRKTCKDIIKKCVQCQRFKSKPFKPNFDQLPTQRVQLGAMKPFEFTGLDYMGPISSLSNGAKTYILLFTCLQTRAIHLELTFSLNLEEFCNAFSRFSSRRGLPTEIRSDNAKTFVAAARKLSVIHNIVWRFNTEKAPWFGGCWERMVRTVKVALRYSLSQKHLNTQELLTLVYHIENLVNHRPITFANGNEEEILPLSPIQFLIPSASLETSRNLSVNRNSYLKAMAQNASAVRKFWTRWKKEYLPYLIENTRNHQDYSIKVGDVMLLNENCKRQHWPLVRVSKLIPGRDGKVRSVQIFLKGKTYTRPLKLLYPLELSPN